jgi:hypothetical protein
VLLRSVEPGDTEALTTIAREPEISRWWGVPGDLGRGLVIEVAGSVAGWLAFEEELDPDYRMPRSTSSSPPACTAAATGARR